MTIIQSAIKGFSWLAAFRAISQLFSWGTTIIVARLLVPDDYGLMEMATIFTGYVVLISELGLGSAIVQRSEIDEKELSSIFWFFLFWGLVLMLVCYLLAIPTAVLFNNPKIIQITQATGIIYIFSVLLIVPRAILLRQLRFRAIGFCEALSIVLSCLVMIFAAYNQFGVWTLIIGHIVREVGKFALFLRVLSWRPIRHYNYREVKPFLSFGLNVALGNSLDYVVNKSDRFFCGRQYDAGTVGLYALGLQIAQMANEKIISLVNNVAFPVFSKYQENLEKSRILLIKLTQLIALVTGPIFFGIAVVGEDLVLVLFGEKWRGAILPLQLLCIGQFFVALTSPFVSVNVAQNRPQWILYFNLAAIAILPPAFYICAQYSYLYLAIPWITLSPLLRIIFAYYTLRQLDLNWAKLIAALRMPLIISLLMSLTVYFLRGYLFQFSFSLWANLALQVAAGVLVVVLCLLFLQKQLRAAAASIWNL
ncbi:MAG: lipopolysaccharide biosynthesis protein [Deltaproteobacteria bacterium]|nr:lipopolysaccharide biosynthesis protein [Deltaproteobacteria bacterium]